MSSNETSTESNAVVKEQAPFYVVSEKKLALMTFFTFGLYWWYCFYHHWRLHGIRTERMVFPVMRTAFGIFFIYPLLSRVNQHIRESGGSHSWSILTLTLLYYGMLVPAFVSSFLIDDSLAIALVVELILMFAWLYILMVMQRGINVSAGDTAGKSNSQFSVANVLWMVPGVVVEIAKVFIFVKVLFEG